MNRLPSGGRLVPGDQLAAPGGRVRLVLQADGNLVLYRTDDERALWASGTHGQPVATVDMQPDGNLVAYTAGGAALWASGTDGRPGAWLDVQDDGNAVIYTPGGAVWATHTVQRFGPVRAGDFRPSTHAPLFSNTTGWPDGTNLGLDVPGLPAVGIDVTRFGLCGGMSFLTRDIVETGGPQLRGRDSRRIPRALAQHILGRLLDSFGGAGVVNRWLAATRAADRTLHGRNLGEVPAILDDLDAGRLCPLGLVLTRSVAPWAVFENHVVLAWGYQRRGDELTLNICDSNRPGRDDIVIRVHLATPGAPATNGTKGDGLRGFFRLPTYRRKPPDPAYIDDAVLTADPGGGVTARNTGSTTWTPAGYRLGSAPVPHPVDPGETVRVESAPGEMRTVATSWRMHRGDTPFGAGLADPGRDRVTDG